MGYLYRGKGQALTLQIIVPRPSSLVFRPLSIIHRWSKTFLTFLDRVSSFFGKFVG